jgi:hypothetical protein
MTFLGLLKEVDWYSNTALTKSFRLQAFVLLLTKYKKVGM